MTSTTTTTTASASFERLVRARLPGLEIEAVVEGDVDVFVVKPKDVTALAGFLMRDRDAVCDTFVDLTVVERGPRLWLVVCLASRNHDARVQIRAVLDDDDPAYPTLTRLWAQAWTAEREAWELFGVAPLGHPSLRRALLPEGFAGHPGLARYRLHKAQPQARPTDGPARVVIDIDTNDGGASGGGT